MTAVGALQQSRLLMRAEHLLLVIVIDKFLIDHDYEQEHEHKLER